MNFLKIITIIFLCSLLVWAAEAIYFESPEKVKYLDNIMGYVYILR